MGPEVKKEDKGARKIQNIFYPTSKKDEANVFFRPGDKVPKTKKGGPVRRPMSRWALKRQGRDCEGSMTTFL